MGKKETHASRTKEHLRFVSVAFGLHCGRWKVSYMSELVFSCSHSRKTVNTKENFWNVYCFTTNQKRDETAEDNRQTAAWISNDLIRNNELAFSSYELAFLPRLTLKNQTTDFGTDLEAKFTPVQVFLLSYKKRRIENHQSQPTSMTL